MSATSDVPVRGWWPVMAVPLCMAVDASVVFAALESPIGSLGIFDDTPPEGSVLVPFLACVLVGLLQVIAFGTATALVSAILLALAGLASLMYAFVAGVAAIGCALGGAVGLLARRQVRLRGATPAVAAGVVLVAVGLGSTAYGLTRTDPPDQPLLEVTAVEGGPSVVVDPQLRAPGSMVTGTLADVGGCLGLVDSTIGNGTILVAWEPGTTASAVPYTLTYSAKSYGLGDRVVVKSVGLLTLPVDLEAYGRDLPASCRDRDLLLTGSQPVTNGTSPLVAGR